MASGASAVTAVAVAAGAVASSWPELIGFAPAIGHFNSIQKPLPSPPCTATVTGNWAMLSSTAVAGSAIGVVVAFGGEGPGWFATPRTVVAVLNNFGSTKEFKIESTQRSKARPKCSL